MRALVLAALLSGCAGREPMGPQIADAAGEVADAGQLDAELPDAGPLDAKNADATCEVGGEFATWNQATFTRFEWTTGGVCTQPPFAVLTIYWREDASVWVWRIDMEDGGVNGALAEPPSTTTIDTAVSDTSQQAFRNRVKAGATCVPGCGTPAARVSCAITIQCPEGETSFGLEAWAE